MSDVEATASPEKSEQAVSLVPSVPGSGLVEPFSGESALAVAGSLLLVLLFFGVLTLLMRRFQSFSPQRSNGIQVLSQLRLSNRERVVLLKVGSDRVLVGCSAAGLRSLQSWQGTELDEEPTDTPSAGFTDTLRDVLSARGQS